MKRMESLNKSKIVEALEPGAVRRLIDTIFFVEIVFCYVKLFLSRYVSNVS